MLQAISITLWFSVQTCRKDWVEKVADVMEKGQLGGMLLAGTLSRSKGVKANWFVLC